MQKHEFIKGMLRWNRSDNKGIPHTRKNGIANVVCTNNGDSVLGHYGPVIYATKISQSYREYYVLLTRSFSKKHRRTYNFLVVHGTEKNIIIW
jgi:hypothetical protein